MNDENVIKDILAISKTHNFEIDEAFAANNTLPMLRFAFMDKMRHKIRYEGWVGWSTIVADKKYIPSIDFISYFYGSLADANFFKAFSFPQDDFQIIFELLFTNKGLAILERDWHYISKYQSPSEEFMLNNIAKMCSRCLSENNNLEMTCEMFEMIQKKSRLPQGSHY